MEQISKGQMKIVQLEHMLIVIDSWIHFS